MTSAADPTERPSSSAERDDLSRRVNAVLEERIAALVQRKTQVTTEVTQARAQVAEIERFRREPAELEKKLEPGMVFTIDPMIWLPEELLYIRIEDMALVTDDGVENLSGFVPARIADVQRTIAEPGLVQLHKPVPAPTGPGGPRP